MDRDRNAEFFDLLDRASTFILANLLWVAVSIPLVTMPVATAGLFAVMTRWARGTRPNVFSDFFSAVRQHWRKATVVGVLDVLVGGLVYVNFLAFQRMDMSHPVAIVSRSMTVFVTLAAIMVNLYLWPLMVTFDAMPVRRLLENSVRLVFAHPLWSFWMLVLALVPLVVSLFLPGAALVLATFSTIAFLVSKAAWRVIRRYAPEEVNETEAGQ
jgi:uncharacterized membrane protein YesL